MLYSSDLISKHSPFIFRLQVKSGKTEKLPAVAGKAKDAKKTAPAPAALVKPVVVAQPAKIDEVKAVKPVAAAKPAPKKRGVVAKAAAATGKGRINKKQLLRGKGLKKKKIQLRFTIDCTNIAEDSIMDVTDFVSCRSYLHFRRRRGDRILIFRIHAFFFAGEISARAH